MCRSMTSNIARAALVYRVNTGCYYSLEELAAGYPELSGRDVARLAALPAYGSAEVSLGRYLSATVTAFAR
mgnify:CR=1 FL=1